MKKLLDLNRLIWGRNAIYGGRDLWVVAAQASSIVGGTLLVSGLVRASMPVWLTGLGILCATQVAGCVKLARSARRR
jgi:hypothetical protein